MFGAKKGLLQASFEAANVIDFSVGSGIESVYQLTANVCKLSAETKIDCDYIKKTHFSSFTSFKELRVHNRIVSYRSRFVGIFQRTHFNNHSNSAINNIKTLSMPNERENAEKYA